MFCTRSLLSALFIHEEFKLVRLPVRDERTAETFDAVDGWTWTDTYTRKLEWYPFLCYDGVAVTEVKVANPFLSTCFFRPHHPFGGLWGPPFCILFISMLWPCVPLLGTRCRGLEVDGRMFSLFCLLFGPF